MLAVEWKPGAPPPAHWPRARKRKATATAAGGTLADDGATGGGAAGGGGGNGGDGGGDGGGRGRHGVVRLFAFGKEAARRKVRGSVEWDAGLDWFVA